MTDSIKPVILLAAGGTGEYFLSVGQRPGTRRRVATAYQVIDQVDMVVPVDLRLGC
jgi:hypothetical protein